MRYFVFIILLFGVLHDNHGQVILHEEIWAVNFDENDTITFNDPDFQLPDSFYLEFYFQLKDGWNFLSEGSGQTGGNVFEFVDTFGNFIDVSYNAEAFNITYGDYDTVSNGATISGTQNNVFDTTFINMKIKVKINIVDKSFSDYLFNNEVFGTSTASGSGLPKRDKVLRIGRFLDTSSVWGFKIVNSTTDELILDIRGEGYDANTDDAWLDRAGNLVGTVKGSPTVEQLR